MRRFHVVLAGALPLMTLIVIVMGAYVRLADAGLGCPDWPGCYGRLVVPATADDIVDPARFAVRPLEIGKAWREMIHRYLASGLGALILLLAASAWSLRQRQSPTIPLLLVPLVILQGLLGMWTVTLLLKPLIVVAHLMGGFTLVALLWWNLLETRQSPRLPLKGLRCFSGLALATLVLQVFLGGWTSANYAALACTDFPRCHGQWWPTVDFRNAFILWRGLGVNYEFGVLDTPARIAIHMAHRVGACLMLVIGLGLIAYVRRVADAHGRRIAWCILALLALQVMLGITNVLRGLPLPVAVMHNGVAALLLLSLVTLFRYASPLRRSVDRDRKQR